MTQRLSRRTAATTRFSPEGIGCQKQMAPTFCQQSDQVGLYRAIIHQMAPPKRGRTHLIIALLLTYRPQKDERLSWPSWLTCSRAFTYISGHLSAAGQAQDRESSQYQHSFTVLRNQPNQPDHMTDYTTSNVLKGRCCSEGH